MPNDMDRPQVEQTRVADGSKPEAYNRNGDTHAHDLSVRAGVPARGESHPHEHPRPGSHRGPSVGGLLLTAVVAVACGGGGAWAYEAYLKPEPGRVEADQGSPVTKSAEDRDKEAAPAPAAPTVDTASADDVKSLARQLDALSGRLDRIQERLAAVPSAGSSDDLGDIKSQLANLRRNHESMQELPDRVSALDDRVNAIDRAVGQIRAEVSGLTGMGRRAGGHALASLASPPPGRSNPGRIAPIAGAASFADPSLAEGAELFRTGKYDKAFSLFDRLEKVNPDDARVWYFAALARGLSSGKWDGETLRLVNKGVEREKAGTPAPKKIDAAFADLTKATGKDWLAGYRKQASAR